jgi:hypothetical protein
MFIYFTWYLKVNTKWNRPCLKPSGLSLVGESVRWWREPITLQTHLIARVKMDQTCERSGWHETVQKII